MWMKNDIMKKAGYDYGYMKPEIEEAMKKWEEKKCHIIFYKINIYISKDGKYLSIFNCPFCIKYESYYNAQNCFKCEYGKINGICGNDKSVWNKYKKIKIFIDDILTNEVYKQIIKELENE
jgi:hypothetical protein